MLDYLVLYQSESGNTKKIAASIFSRLPGNSKDLIDIDTDKTIPEANVYFIGFCVHRGSCSMEVSDFLSDLSGKQIALFGTCGMGDSPEYYKDIAGRVSAWIEADNDYLGYFICQGKMPQKVRELTRITTRSTVLSRISILHLLIRMIWMWSMQKYSSIIC